jgi:molybdopterin/thiamine biosynthesis adenylyltransferase
MESFDVSNRSFAAAMSADVHQVLREHLLRMDGQEDLCFALWTPSEGGERLTVLIHTVLLPEPDERQVHGNVSYNPRYLRRACDEAMRVGCGIALLHSHPAGRGWQGMSDDDIKAEQRCAGPAGALTGLPFVGLTIAGDEHWSARVWTHQGGRVYQPQACRAVRVVGTRLVSSFYDRLVPSPVFREQLRRTISVWGEENHAKLARLRIGIVGLGSVGSIVAESLARMGMTDLVLIDFDTVEYVNLDRLVIATEADVGRLKVEVAQERIERVATAAHVCIRGVPFSVAEAEGYRAALDCDVIFSCVDRARPRHILNHLAYAHLIPVIDGGIQVRFKFNRFSGVDWQLQTAGPERACLQCLGTYDPADVSTEEAGLMDDPSYIAGLGAKQIRRNENVFPFATNLASLEVLQLVALVTGIGGIGDFGVQRYRYVPGIVQSDVKRRCDEGCEQRELVAHGDRHFSLIGRDLAAEQARSEHRFKLEARLTSSTTSATSTICLHSSSTTPDHGSSVAMSP